MIFIKVLYKTAVMSPADKKLVLVRAMAWQKPGNKSLMITVRAW